tara:strand:+ start:164 stop:1030 length:867 start_codon:yes stop_codon:yes gene_type:complete
MKHIKPYRNHDEKQKTKGGILQAINISAGYDKNKVIRDVSCQLFPGELLGIIGPNGSGKSTLLKTLSGNLKPLNGQIILDNKPLNTIYCKSRAQMLTMLPQHPDAPQGMTVNDLVSCGRTPHRRFFDSLQPSDHMAIDYAIHTCKLKELANRSLDQISGGERQRAWIGMAIAQETQVLLLDEPTSALDVAHQLDVMHLLEHLANKKNLAIAVAMHDINLTIRFCQRLLIINHGQLIGESNTNAETNWNMLENVFDVKFKHLQDSDNSQFQSFTCHKINLIDKDLDHDY